MVALVGNGVHVVVRAKAVVVTAMAHKIVPQVAVSTTSAQPSSLTGQSVPPLPVSVPLMASVQPTMPTGPLRLTAIGHRKSVLLGLNVARAARVVTVSIKSPVRMASVPTAIAPVSVIVPKAKLTLAAVLALTGSAKKVAGARASVPLTPVVTVAALRATAMKAVAFPANPKAAALMALPDAMRPVLVTVPPVWMATKPTPAAVVACSWAPSKNKGARVIMPVVKAHL